MATPSLSFLHGQFVPRCTHDIDKHFEGYCTLQYMAGGAVELGVGGQRYGLEGQWFWSAYPGPRIRFRPAEGTRSWVHRYIAFRGPRVGQWMGDGLFPITPQQPPNGRDYGPVFDELLACSRRGGRWAVIRATHLLEGILIDLAESRTHPAHGQRWLQRVVGDVGHTATEAATADLAHLAGELNVSLSTLRRRFKQATGAAPHSYLLQQRILAARQLLAEGDMPIKSIAQRLGYRDVYFFSRQFRRFVGMPPGLYRRSCQG